MSRFFRSQLSAVIAVRRPGRQALFACLLIAFCMASVPSVSMANTTPDELKIQVGVFVDSYDQADRSDLRFTFDAWADHFATDRFPIIELKIYENETRFQQEMEAGTLDVGVCYSYQYPQLFKNSGDPPFIMGRDVEPLVELMLLVRRDAGIDTAGDLKGNKIVLNSSRRGKLPLIWLQRYLISEGVSEDAAAFGELTFVGESFGAIAPVFFGNASACVITRKEFQENAALNSQLVQDLHVMATSLNLPTRVLFLSSVIDRDKRDAIELRLATMEPAKFSRSFMDPVHEAVIPYEKGDLAEVAKLSVPSEQNAAISQSTERLPRDAGEEKK